MKKRARRRLVGAAALALFAVLVLPMVMDREPRPLNQDIQVRIPSQDATGLAAKVIPGKPVASPMPAPEAVTEPKSEPKPEVKPEPVAAPAPAAKPAEKSAPPEKKAATDKKPAAKIAADAKPAPVASGQWVVQLGAYKETGNVKLLLAKLKGIGVPAYTENFDSPQGSRTRVRAGPFPSQEAAEKARSRIKIIGVDGPVAPK
ncbi:SPOR domain-containing protein [Sulfuritalea sp.]|uniref:SPOR domain-containing protein n=1 Tax=Sulfuritalea sp. TaxID=2480090 RepID=UPI00286D792A|nr:SPOR domain-containing protein [Sulfuritalea sp.]